MHNQLRERRCRLPDRRTTCSGRERRVGVEIELSGLGYRELVELTARLLGGSARETSRYVSEVETDLGTFVVELDSDPIKELSVSNERIPRYLRELGTHAIGVVDYAAERIVPLEIVSPPIPLSRLEVIEALCEKLREAGGLGSREAVYYAFGLQLNPELPALDADTLLPYLQAFTVLYDWLKARHQTDLSRKLTPYIEPWNSSYVARLTAASYRPDLHTLMTDYLRHNPTRNRALDLLPLFACLDPGLLGRYVQDPRIKARPTLHYRLPDCDIDNPDWHFSTVWNDWVVLEQLAANPEHLGELCVRFRESKLISLYNLTSSWRVRCEHWLVRNGYI